MKLLIVIALVCVTALVIYSFTRRPATVDKSLATYAGRLYDYRGGKKLIVAFTASWASVWKLTATELAKLDFTRFDLCILDDAIDHSEIERHGISFLPTVALVENGQLTKRVQNLTSIEEIRDW